MASSTRRVEAALERWAREVYGKAAQKPGALRQQQFATTSGVELDPLYVPRDTDYEEKLGFPGEYPFTRGIQPTMYRGRFWTMRQYAGFGTAEETNRRFRYLLASGQTGLSTAFDLPTQMGHDSDSPRARGEVGRVGVAIDSVEDMERLFAGIELGKVSTSMTINATAATLLALYQAVGEAHGTPARELSGTVQNDVLKEYIARGTYIYPPGPSMRIITDVFAYCAEAMPKWNPISISGYHIREAGSTAAQGIALTLADGRDEALALPTEASARIALRTQQIIAHESGAADIVDPLGGSYALESLTDDLEERAIAYLTRIDEMGGMVEAIAQGYPQREIDEAAYQYQREIEEKKRVIVGVNQFASEGEAPFDTMQVDPALEERQVKKLRAFRASRSQDAVTR